MRQSSVIGRPHRTGTDTRGQSEARAVQAAAQRVVPVPLAVESYFERLGIPRRDAHLLDRGLLVLGISLWLYGVA